MDQENYNQNNDSYIDEQRKQKVQNFKFNISQEDLAVGEEYRHNEDNPPLAQDNFDDRKETLSSYSGDDVKAQMERNSKSIKRRREKDIKKEKKFIDRKNKRTYKMIWWVSVLLAGIMLSVFLMTGVNDVLAINRSTSGTVKVSIPKDPTLDDVCHVLSKAGVIDHPQYFKMYATLTKNADTFTQGVYKMKTNMDYEAIINYLHSMANRKDTVKVTIPEGENVREIAKRLKKAKVIESTSAFLKLCKSSYFDKDYTFLTKGKNVNKRYYKLEGFLFPDTYECYVNEDPKLTITRMLNTYELRMTTAQTVSGFKNSVNVSKVAKDKNMSMSTVLTIASIIQAEASDQEDMYNISSVIHNRLDSGSTSSTSRLDCDSTSYYPYRSKKNVPASKRKTFKSSYNTYKIKGLPAGPICNPGMQAICAALYPNDTSYLYFCHNKKTGQAYYASTLYQHNINLYTSGNR